MSKIITFGTLKGGTGKTTAVFSSSGILSERGYKVLVIDADPQGNVTSNLGVDETKQGYLCIKDILEKDYLIPEDVVIKAPLIELPNLDLIGSSMTLTSTEMNIISLTGREYLLRKYIKKHNKFFNQYDFILIDTNPSMSIINQNSFIASDKIIIVSDLGVNSLKGIELFIALWEDILLRLDMKNNICGILINKVIKHSHISNEFMEYCKEEEDINKLLFKTCISDSEILPICELDNKPINISYKGTEVYGEFSAFVDELLERVK
ncbi:MAG TPA: AAA family ATPase [Clostridiaceae bacterium]